MSKTFFKRKIYNEILEWKENKSDKYALLIKGARRVGKSTIVEEFAKNEFKSYILIDFAHTSKEIIALFDDTYNLDFFFLQLQQLTKTRLYEKESVIIFDEVQLLPKARQAIKYLVADGRYKYIETGSLLSIKRNTKDILIPSEEHKISMYPMDFEEFLWALGDEITPDTIKMLLKTSATLLWSIAFSKSIEDVSTAVTVTGSAKSLEISTLIGVLLIGLVTLILVVCLGLTSKFIGPQI